MQKKKMLRSIALVCAALLLLAAGAGAGWLLAERRANRQAEAYRQQWEAELAELRSQLSGAESLSYQRVLDSWTATLADQYADVVFLGDSLTAGGSWGEYYVNYMVSNLGVVGDTVDHLLLRTAQPELLMPNKCFLMIGVNDLIYGSDADTVLEKYDRLLAKLSAQPMQVYVQSVLPVREDQIRYPVRNEAIRQLNLGIEALADRYGMPYIDVHSLFADEAGQLDAAVSYDGLHLSAAGYERWQQALLPYVQE